MDYEHILYIKSNCIKTDAFCSFLGEPRSLLYQEASVAAGE